MRFVDREKFFEFINALPKMPEDYEHGFINALLEVRGMILRGEENLDERLNLYIEALIRKSDFHCHQCKSKENLIMDYHAMPIPDIKRKKFLCTNCLPWKNPDKCDPHAQSVDK